MLLCMQEMLETDGNIMSPEEAKELEKITAERDELLRIVDELRAEVSRLSQIAKY